MPDQTLQYTATLTAPIAGIKRQSNCPTRPASIFMSVKTAMKCSSPSQAIALLLGCGLPACAGEGERRMWLNLWCAFDTTPDILAIY